MMNFFKLTLVLALALSYQPHLQAHEGHDHQTTSQSGHTHDDQDDGTYHEHPEEGIALPFDSPFCDLNDNGVIDPEEMTKDNLCMLGEGEELFAQKPIASLGLKKGQLVLTIDDGPNAKVTRPILDLLDQYGIKATFFLTGNRIPNNAALVREMVARGHFIGNHTYSHDIAHINAATITSEILQAHRALVNALGHEPTTRLLFRAPGLGWSSPKALVLNENQQTRQYIGPIHANLGTDAPRADWSCWSKHVPAETCANYYFHDIVNMGRGIILSHDVFYKEGQGNTYEMLKILLHRLDTEAGGIANKTGSGVWTFTTMNENSVLDQFDVSENAQHAETNPQSGHAPGQAPAPAPQTIPAPAPVPTPGKIPGSSAPSSVNPSITNKGVFVRSLDLKAAGILDDSSKIYVNDGVVITGMIETVSDEQDDLTINNARFKKIKIEKAQVGYESLEGQIVYISTKAFN